MSKTVKYPYHAGSLLFDCYSFNRKSFFFFFLSSVDGVSVGGEWRRLGIAGAAGSMCRECMRVPLYPGEATGQAVMGKASLLPCFPPPPQAPFQWPSLFFQSITQPIKERELGVRLNPQHTETHTYTCTL